MPKVYIPVQTLVPLVVLQLRSHLVLQNSIKSIVGSSVIAGGDAASATVSRVVADRLGALD